MKTVCEFFLIEKEPTDQEYEEAESLRLEPPEPTMVYARGLIDLSNWEAVWKDDNDNFVIFMKSGVTYTVKSNETIEKYFRTIIDRDGNGTKQTNKKRQG